MSLRALLFCGARRTLRASKRTSVSGARTVEWRTQSVDCAMDKWLLRALLCVLVVGTAADAPSEEGSRWKPRAASCKTGQGSGKVDSELSVRVVGAVVRVDVTSRTSGYAHCRILACPAVLV